MEEYKKNLQKIPYKNLHTFAGYKKNNTRDPTNDAANAELRALYNEEIARRNSERFSMKQRLEMEMEMNPEITSLAGIKGKKMTMKQQLKKIKKYYNDQHEQLLDTFYSLSNTEIHKELDKGIESDFWLLLRTGPRPHPKGGGFTRRRARRGRSLEASQQ